MLITMFNIFKLFSTFENLLEMNPLSHESEVIDLSQNCFLEIQYQYGSQGKILIGHSIVQVTEDSIHLIFEPILDINVFLPLKSYDISSLSAEAIERFLISRISKNIQLKYSIDKEMFIQYCEPE